LIVIDFVVSLELDTVTLSLNATESAAGE